MVFLIWSQVQFLIVLLCWFGSISCCRESVLLKASICPYCSFKMFGLGVGGEGAEWNHNMTGTEVRHS